MSIIPEELKTQSFPCPKCGQFINDEMPTCRYCKVEISSDERSTAAANAIYEKKAASISSQKRTLVFGVVVLLASIANLIVPIVDFSLNYADGSKIPCLSIVGIIVGATITLIGLNGYIRERNR
jgi:hypothetical protein